MAQCMLRSFNKVLHGMLPKRVLGTPSELRDAADNAELFLMGERQQLVLLVFREVGADFSASVSGNARGVQTWCLPAQGARRKSTRG